ncbi:N-acetyl-gamma-glutamyl-phosphate reductase [Alloacidobacterium dinghuense]|uniref:N-acetyl-gamma-glutamyl-phosphate reductase n=1 Tax=Alloacidobacterium dinghuense TaxID=2763107 RepID=A0A7G8BMU9_9BACT|nr:N-acetyl-gamma-glutamyl-phosphate reductase [Alloacidobacterium dinghuense]QNI33869.1 N-acetyl-gamma-glutamyl-phosphate reductase [Alloacidobacterium dinghuense]
MKKTLQTAVMGVTGYAGLELARLLLRHPKLQGSSPLFLGRAEATAHATPLTDLHPHLLDNNGSRSLKLEPFSWGLLRDRGVDVLFLATPHEQSRELAPAAIEHGLRVIDLSGAWRLDDAQNRSVYKFEDEGSATAVSVQTKSVYGMPELHRGEIKDAVLVANPGCFATSVILALKPLQAQGWIDLDRGIVSDSKSGVSGAGKTPSAKTHFMHAADNLSAYGVFGHRHTGELLEQLDLLPEQVIFTPHLLPIPRGILSTIYVSFKDAKQATEIEACYREFYRDSPMVRVFPSGQLPQIQYSVRTNYCDIGFHLAPDGRRCVIVSCLDNLLKGAAGQAVQNLNVMYGWNESEGLA